MLGLEEVLAYDGDFHLREEAPGDARVAGGIAGDQLASEGADVAIGQIEGHAAGEIERRLRHHLMAGAGAGDNGAVPKSADFGALKGPCRGRNRTREDANWRWASTRGQSLRLRWSPTARYGTAREAGSGRVRAKLRRKGRSGDFFAQQIVIVIVETGEIEIERWSQETAITGS